ncbi:STAS domain-containing protein [Pseudoalteromonas sp. T1lg76]|uniref:STAS domain-containing protein n=1 Tax=Pseudoalteromonas sp. T1lg76 TaxID=2077103 RepID=UPI000CF6A82E|nr:STAS domain-containing protein [Pseudoalteromonas sp. T1lg76]
MSSLTLSQLSDDQFTLSGELTRYSVADKTLVQQLLASGSTKVALDLNDVSHVDTAGLAWLLDSLSQLHKQGKELRLQHIPEQLQKLMQLGQVDKIFE